MSEDADNTSESTGNSQDSSNTEALSGSKTRRRENAAKKGATGDRIKKSGSKNPSGEGAPTADGQSIPSSVDPDAPSNTGGESGGDSSSTE